MMISLLPRSIQERHLSNIQQSFFSTLFFIRGDELLDHVAKER